MFSHPESIYQKKDFEQALTPEMGQIADAQGDLGQKRGNATGKTGALPEKLNPIRSQSSLRSGIHCKHRVIRGALISIRDINMKY